MTGANNKTKKDAVHSEAQPSAKKLIANDHLHNLGVAKGARANEGGQNCSETDDLTVFIRNDPKL